MGSFIQLAEAVREGSPGAILEPASGHVLAPPASGTVSATACGQRSLLLRVMAKQAGTFHVVVSVP